MLSSSFTANQALLDAFSGHRRIHVIDFGINHDLQWPALLQALAVRLEGPPFFRLTAIGLPHPDSASDPLQEVGLKLAQLAETLQIDFEYRDFVAHGLTDLEPYILKDDSPPLLPVEEEVNRGRRRRGRRRDGGIDEGVGCGGGG